MRYVGYFFAGLTGLALLIGLGWLLTGNQLLGYRFFAPKFEQARRETFEQSHAYRQGMVQQLQNMQLEYIQATPEQRGGIASIALHRVGDVADPESLPSDIRQFVTCLRSSQAAANFTANCASN